MKRTVYRKLVIEWTENVEVEEYDNDDDYEAHDGCDRARELLVEAGIIAQHAKECILGRLPSAFLDEEQTIPTFEDFTWDIHTSDYAYDPRYT